MRTWPPPSPSGPCFSTPTQSARRAVRPCPRYPRHAPRGKRRHDGGRPPRPARRQHQSHAGVPMGGPANQGPRRPVQPRTTPPTPTPQGAVKHLRYAGIPRQDDGSNHPDVVALRYRASDLFRCRSAGPPTDTARRLRRARLGAHPPPVACPGNHRSRPTPNESEEPPHSPLNQSAGSTTPGNPTRPSDPSTPSSTRPSVVEPVVHTRVRPLRATREDHRHTCRSPLRGSLR
jgi:hypothetical protein